MQRLASSIDPIQPFWVVDSVRYLKKTSSVPAIAHFYKFKASNGVATSCAIPDGAIDIVMECGTERLSAWICGPVSQGSAPGFEENKTYFGIRLRPEALGHVGDASVADLAGHKYSLGEVARNPEALEFIAQERDFGNQARLFEGMLVRDMADTPTTDTARRLTASIIDEIYRRHGAILVSELEAELCYSRRHLTRCFTATMGMDIKTFSRHVRFQYVLHGIRDGAFASVAEAAMAGAYCDQSHLQKDFRAFANTTPYGMMRLFQESDYAHRITLCT